MRIRNCALYLIAFSLTGSWVLADPIALTVKPGLQELEIEFEAPPDEIPEGYKPPDVSWQAAYPINLIYKSKTSKLEGWSSLFFIARKGGKYAIDSDVIDWELKERTRQRWIITVEGAPPPDPDPDPDPDPKPEGLAGEIYKRVKAINRPGDAAKLLKNYETVASMIAAGGIKTVSGANLAIKERNLALDLSPDHWLGFSTWLNTYSIKNAQTLEGTRKVFEAMVEGLKAAIQ